MQLRRYEKPAGKSRQKRTGTAKPRGYVEADLSRTEQEIFEKLRWWRVETARVHNVPAYIIFHDATMREIAKAKPDTLDALRGVSRQTLLGVVLEGLGRAGKIAEDSLLQRAVHLVLVGGNQDSVAAANLAERAALPVGERHAALAAWKCNTVWRDATAEILFGCGNIQSRHVAL